MIAKGPSRKLFTVCLVVLISCLTSTVSAEIFELADGRIIEGDVSIETPELVVIRTLKGKVSVKPSEIKARRKSLDKNTEYQQRLEKLMQNQGSDPEAWRTLARWCLAKKLTLEAEQCYSRLAALKPKDPEATKALTPDNSESLGAELRQKLQSTRVHFDFKMASVQTIMLAVSNASGVPINIDKQALASLKRKRLKLRYQSEHTALRALNDITKSSKLEYLIDSEQVTIGTNRSINKLRKKLGVKEKRRKILSGAQVAKMLETSQHSLSMRDQTFDRVLLYFRKNTPIPFVYSGPQDLLSKKLSIDTYQQPLGQLLDRILKPLGLDYMRQGNVILIASSEVIGKQKQAKKP